MRLHSWQSHDTREEFGANRRHGTLVHMVLGSSIREGGVEKEWRKGWLPWGAVPSLSRSVEFLQGIRFGLCGTSVCF